MKTYVYKNMAVHALRLPLYWFFTVDTPTCFMSLRLGDLINWISMRLCFGLLV